MGWLQVMLHLALKTTLHRFSCNLLNEQNGTRTSWNPRIGTHNGHGQCFMFHRQTFILMNVTETAYLMKLHLFHMRIDATKQHLTSYCPVGNRQFELKC